MPTQRTIKWAAARGLDPNTLTPEERKAARGHEMTPEHGTPALRGIQKHVQVGPHDIRASASDRQAERNIYRASNHEGARVNVWVHTPADGWQIMGGKRGYSAAYLAEQVHSAGGLRNAIAGGAIHGGGGNDSDTVDDADDIDAWQIDEM